METIKYNHEYRMKNVKTFRGMEGEGFNGNLYHGKKMIAFVIDSGQGGCYDYEIKDKARFNEFLEYLKTLPKMIFHDTELDINDEIFIGQLVSDYIEEKEMKKIFKLTANHIVIEHEEGRFTTWKYPAKFSEMSKTDIKRIKMFFKERIIMEIQKGAKLINQNFTAEGDFVNG
ncbi:MAG: hypothetical protein OEY34_07880 [Cyclobacteriaceae bacterium]|nr:hypothetical protein [Cyclobacteriaceae bacterium]